MKSILTVLLAISIYLCFTDIASGAATQPPAEGGVLPSIDLAAPQSEEYQQYLGIAGKKSFTIPEIKAEVVLIEIFSMY